MKYKSLIAKILLFAMTLQILPVLNYDTIPFVSALDTDGTANLDLTLSSEVDPASIVGSNFTLDINLENLATSEDDAYNPGFIVKIPADTSFVASNSLGSPIRTEVLSSGETLLFFETESLLPLGTNENYSIQFASDVGVDLFTDLDVEVLAYAEDNIYGVGLPPSGSPSGTLPGGIDFANSTDDPTDLNFPDSVDNNTDLSTLPFSQSTTLFLPFNVEKIGVPELLIGEMGVVTLRVTGNDLGPLNDFEIVDVIPNNQKFVGFTSTMGAATSVQYDTPTPGQVTLTITDIDVPTGGVVDIQYETLALAYEASSYNPDGTVNLDTNAQVNDLTVSENVATQQIAGTWNDGTNDIPVNANSVIEEKTYETLLSFGNLSKSVNNISPVIGDTIRYTLTYDVAQNMSYNSNGEGTFIRDVLPDGLTFVQQATTLNSGSGDALSLTTNEVNTDGDTELIWTLPAGGNVDAGDFLTISYDVLVDGLYEGAGDGEYENTQSIINNAFFQGNIQDSGNNEEWGYTDPDLIDTPDTDGTSISITAPEPTIDKQLVTVVTPDGTVYNAANPLPAGVGIPVESRLDFVISMEFPNVNSIGSVLKDALPLVAGPNTDTYNIVFQTDTTLLDLDGNPVPINDDNLDGTPDTIFNGQTLGGSTPTDTAWITTSPANNLEFDIASGAGEKIFALGFSVDILPVKPSGGQEVKNILIGSFLDDDGQINILDIIKEPFEIGLPDIAVQKSTDPDTIEDIAAGDIVDYEIIIQNTGNAPGYLELIEDIMPENMILNSFTALYDGPTNTPVPGANVIQNGEILEINFDVQGVQGRSFLGIDDAATAGTDESTIILTYSLTPTNDFVIIGEDERQNVIAFDYYSSGNADPNDLNKIGEATDTAEFYVVSPLITRDYVSTSEVDSPDNQPGDRPDIFAGEETTFETIISLPPGTYLNTEFIEDLSSKFDFVSGTVISTGPNLTIENVTVFDGDSVDFGDIVNTGTTNQEIVIQTTARAKGNTTRRSNNKAEGEFFYSGEFITINTPVDVLIPTLVVTKSVTPTVADTSDTLTYNINIDHTSRSDATAYDIILNDELPANIEFIPGTLTGNTNFTGSEADLFSGTGIVLDALRVVEEVTLSFDARVQTGATAGDEAVNNVDIAYSSLDDDASPVEGNYTADSSAEVIFKDIDIVHSIVSTNNDDTEDDQFNTNFEDLTIGEELIYNIEIDIPELVYEGVTVTQTLPEGFTILDGEVLTNDVANGVIQSVVINPDNTITFTFGDIDNTGVDAGAGFTLATTVLVTDDVDITAGDVVNSEVEISYDDGNSASDNTPNFDVIEPNLVVTKDYSPNIGDGGDSIPTTITISNTGTAPLYDISWIDTLPPKTSGDADYLPTSSLPVLLPGESFTYTYNTILDSGVEFGEMLTGDLEGTGDSMPGDADEEREYTSDDDDIITIRDVEGLSKELTSPDTEVNIGDIVSYTIQVPVVEGVTGSIDVNDLIPAGLEILPDTINITPSPGVTFDGGIPSVGTQALGTEQEVDYNFTNITNTNTDNAVVEFITITYDALVLNTSDNNAGDTKGEEVLADYNNGTTILSDGPVPVTLLEPNVTIDLESTYTFGNEVSYTFTVTNDGTASAYDIDIDALFPNGITMDDGFVITNDGQQIGFTRNGDSFTLDELPVNTGNPLQFTVTGTIDPDVPDMTDLTASADLSYTGQDGEYASINTNPDNTERDGSGGDVNDYTDSDDDTFTVLLPILDEEITVIDLNGGEGIVGDSFEYTVTLTNSGSVDLTDISALIDIPDGFTGFTIVSTPTGSTDSSDPTAGDGENGVVDVSDIDLLIGQSVTIVYIVTAEDDVESGSIIDTEVQVSDTPEGAIGGTPNIPVTILAPGIQLTKNIAFTQFNDPVQAEDEMGFELIILNTGDVSLFNIELNDPMLGGDITADCSFPITPGVLGAGESAICTPDPYSITERDILRGYVENSAEVTSNDESGNIVEDISDSGNDQEDIETPAGDTTTDGDPTNDPTVQMLIQDPSLRATKQIASTDFNLPNLVGDTITYQIILENTGNLDITDVVVTDPLLGGDITSRCPFSDPAAPAIAVNTTIFCEEITYTIGIADIIRGYVDNNVTIRGLDALGDPVSDISDPGDELVETPSGDGSTDGDPTNDPTTIEIIGEPELTTTKMLTSDTLSTPTAAGDTLNYTITIVNTGQLPVNDIFINDDMLGGDITESCVFPIDGVTTLEVGESATCTPEAYVITEGDIVRGFIDNSAFVEGRDPNNDFVEDTSDPGDEDTETPSSDGLTDGDPTNDPTTVGLIQNPDWEVVKTALTTPEFVGDTIEYNFALSNTGNITIENPVPGDDKCEGFIYYPLNGQNFLTYSIAPGETIDLRCTSIPVTQEEFDAGVVNNTVNIEGETVLGDLPDISDSHELDLEADPSIELMKFALNPPMEAGDVVNYEFIVINTGNVSISTINISDAKCATSIALDPESDIGSDGKLSSQESWTYSCVSIPVTQTEVDAGEVENTAIASGTPARGELEETSDTIQTPVGPLPAWNIEKTLNTPIKNAGDILEYSFELQNRGNVTISDISVTDEKCSLPPVLDASTDIESDLKLSPLETWTYTCNSIPVTQAEVDAGEVINIVSASGTPAQGTLDDASDELTSEVPANPSWTLSKTTDSTPQFAGETLEYRFVLTNTGNTTLSDIVLSDQKCTVTPVLETTSDIGSDELLSPDEAWTYTCNSIPVTQAEVNAEEIVNTATASGSSTRGTLINATDTNTTIVGLSPRLQLYKYAEFNDENSDGLVEFGETISYTFTIKNTGNIDISNITLTDPLIDVTGGPINLAVGEEDTTSFTGTYFILQPDVINGYVQNTATVNGESIGGAVSDTSDAGDDLSETPDANGANDSDPTNDPTVVRFSAPTVETNSSGSSSGGGSSSSRSSSGGGGGGGTRITPQIVEEVEEIPELESAPEAPAPTIEAIKEFSPAEVQEIIESAEELLQDQQNQKDLLEELKAEEFEAGETFIESVPRILPQTGTPISERISTRESNLINTDLPSGEVFRLAGDENTDLEHWTQVLPEQDMNAEKYIVTPSNGMVLPILDVPEASSDYSKMISGREIQLNNYLKNGALEYPGSSTNGYGEVGNKVVFAHSSYWEADDGRYKTHFQKIIELDAGEEIWVYEQDETGVYKRYVYITQESYNTPANDTDVLKPGIGKNLTLFTCTPIGGVEGRWIIQAKYIDEAVLELQREVYYEDVSQAFRQKLTQVMRALSYLPEKQATQKYLEIFVKINEVRSLYENSPQILRMLEFLQLQIAKALLK